MIYDKKIIFYIWWCSSEAKTKRSRFWRKKMMTKHPCMASFVIIQVPPKLAEGRATIEDCWPPLHPSSLMIYKRTICQQMHAWIDKKVWTTGSINRNTNCSVLEQFHPLKMLVLYETALGYCLFKLTDSAKLKSDNLWEEFESPEKASGLYVLLLNVLAVLWYILTSAFQIKAQGPPPLRERCDSSGRDVCNPRRETQQRLEKILVRWDRRQGEIEGDVNCDRQQARYCLYYTTYTIKS